jgi:hypothetical protein
MAVTVTDNRTIVNEGDSTSGWTSSSGKTQLYTSDPPPVEATGSIGHTVSTTTENMYYTMGSSVDLSDSLVFVWTLANGIMDTLVNGGITLVLGDGTNRIGYHLAGSDVASFRYNEGQVSWQCLMVDTSILPTTYYTAYAGSEASLSLSAITQIGAGHKTLAKALGGTENCFIDILRYGDAGLTIIGGTSSDPGTFEEIYEVDYANTDQKAYGVIRELATGVYGVQSPLTFGTSGTGDSYFYDESVTIIFEDRFVDSDKYWLRVIGNTTSGEETHFTLKSCNIQSAKPPVKIDFSDDGIDELDIQSCLFSGITNGIKMSSDSDALNHIFSNNTVTNCGIFDPGKVPIRNCTFSNVSNSEPTSAAFKWNSNIDVSDCSFINNTRTSPSGAASIIHTDSVSASVTYDNLQFSGNDYDIKWLGTGKLTIQATNGSNPTTYYAPNGGTVDIQNAVTLTLTGLVSGSEVRIYDHGTTTERAGVENSGETFEFTYNYSANDYVDIVVHNIYYVYLRIENVLLGNTPSTIPIQQQYDRWYDNPP